MILAWGGALAYMLYIYFDFSGYSDMAIGVAKMFGFEFGENFNYPYMSQSVSEYWRRWHISLGEWFQEYLYYPFSLGPALKIRKKAGKKFNRKQSGMAASGVTLLVVWLCTGIWHGARLTFVVWGLINFAFVWYDSFRKPRKDQKTATITGICGTFIITLITKVIFNSSSISAALHYLMSMFHLAGNTMADRAGIYWLGEYWLYLVLGMIFSFPIIEYIKKKIESSGAIGIRAWNIIQPLATVLLFILAISYMVGGSYNPPVYANF